MAIQTLEFSAASGLTISCKLFAVGSDTVVDTQTATEKTNDVNRYSVDFADIPAGTYRLNGFVGSDGGFANEVFDLTLTTATFQPRSESAGLDAAGVRAAVGLASANMDAQFAAVISSGSGVNLVTVTVNDGTSNVPNARIQLLDSSDNPIGYPVVTASDGVATFNLDDGSYKMVIGYIIGYESHVAQVVNVSGNTAVTLTLTPTATSEATDPALCNVLVRVLNQYGHPAVGATVTAKIDSPNFLVNSVVSNDMVTTATTDSIGEVTLSLIRAVEFIRGGRYNIFIKVGNSIEKFEYYVPDQASAVATFTS